MKPSRKISAVAIGGAVASICVWASKAYAQVEIPPEVASGLTVIVSSLLGYMVPDA